MFVGHGVNIRRAVESDSDRLTKLACLAKGSWGYPPEYLSFWCNELTITPDYIRRHRVFVAESSNEIVGCCAIEDDEESWRLEHVWIHPTHQRLGIGRELVGHALHEAHRVRPGIVTADADPNAAGFYRRIGGRVAGTVAAPLPDAADRSLPVFEFRTATSESASTAAHE